jgi:KaiC/GvpD/RAD55 family RecA-like ATPase
VVAASPFPARAKNLEKEMSVVDPGSERLTTGVPQLDRVLGGGLLRGALTLLIGPPGTGQTLLAQQILFHHAAQGGTALYLTAYSETHAKLLRHSAALSFFQPEFVGTRIQIANLVDLLASDKGDAEAGQAIIAMARQHGATLIILDDFKGMRQLLPHDRAATHFLYSLGARLDLLGATTLIAAEGTPDEPSGYAEITVCWAPQSVSGSTPSGFGFTVTHASSPTIRAPRMAPTSASLIHCTLPWCFRRRHVLRLCSLRRRC